VSWGNFNTRKRVSGVTLAANNCLRLLKEFICAVPTIGIITIAISQTVRRYILALDEFIDFFARMVSFFRNNRQGKFLLQVRDRVSKGKNKTVRIAPHRHYEA